MNKTMWHTSWKKIIFGILMLLVVVLLFFWDFVRFEAFDDPKDGLSCYDLTYSKIPELDENEPVPGYGIYFHESSCPRDNSDIHLDARQSCSIESALIAHPKLDVFLLISSPAMTPLNKTKNIFVKQLLAYKNFKPRHIIFSKYLSNTPMYSIYTSGMLNLSEWPIEHASDVLRYTTLYKFGGIYLDLDVLVLKSLIKLKNFAGFESDSFIGSGILGFSYDKVGREVANTCAIQLSSTYNPHIWGFNGPGVISRVLTERCKNQENTELPTTCEGFQLLPSFSFCPIFYRDVELFFMEGYTKQVKEITSQSYAIHFWNKLSHDIKMDNNLDIPFLNFAKKYCPKIYEVSNGDFNNYDF